MQRSTQLTGEAAVKSFLDLLADDITQSNLSDADREKILVQLKTLGRDVNNVKSVYDGEAVQTLGHYAFGPFTRAVAREALRCIANALILVPSTQDAFAAQNLTPKVARTLAMADDEDEFLASRILFLMTYNKSTDVPRLITEQSIADKIVTQLKRHTARKEPLTGTGITSMALGETLKLLFNLLNFAPNHLALFLPAVSTLFQLLVSATVPEPPLQPPMNALLNALAALEVETGELSPSERPYQYGDKDQEVIIDRLVETLDGSLTAYSNAQLDTQLISLLTILRRINAYANESVKSQLQSKLLTQDSERDLPLGQSSSLASRLLKLTTAPGLMHLPEAVSSLLFELSNSDAHTFIKNVGYGYAAGYLMTHKIPIPENAQQFSAAGGDIPINPVTGQRLDKETNVPMPEMSQEEKEREAERLFVLFERLKATGVVDVKNPVQQAKEEGRFEELSDDDT